MIAAAVPQARLKGRISKIMFHVHIVPALHGVHFAYAGKGALAEKGKEFLDMYKKIKT